MSKERKAALKRRNGLAWRSHRGRRAGHGHRGFPRNLGGPVVSAESGTDFRGEPKEGGKGGRESERLIVPERRGNRPGGTPWREGDAGTRNF